ncbi:MAG: protein kinase [Isosphaeraceae bacterium]|nr:protein kinase [Isosphaeraceae bacterium]
MADEAPQAEKPELRIGSYRVTEQLGSGGMSSVFRAVHDETGHEVAVKVLPRSLAKNPALLQRFLREANTAEALEHPNIVSIFDRGVDKGRHYLVLEFVPGGDLHDRVKNQGPLPIPEAIRVVKEVASGLSYAASLGLIHRDVKPANILVSPTGQVKIIDLGLALQAESEDERVTRDGTTVGTVDYMSPEQARDSRATSEKSDMYSLGCTLYYLLTGSAPFAGGDLADKLARHCTQAAPDPRKLRPEVSASLASLTRKSMAKRPENRFESYAQLIAALDAVAARGAGGVEQGEVLDALIVDDDDDDDLMSSASTPTLDALVVDDSEPELPVRKTGRPPSTRGKATPAAAAPVDLLSMADLAALDDDAPAAKPARPPRPAAAPVEPVHALLDEGLEEHVAALPGRSARSSFQFGDASSKTLIKRSIAIGVTVILLVIGAHQLFEAAHETPSASIPEPEPSLVPRPAVVNPGEVRIGPSAPNVTVVKKALPTKAEPRPEPAAPWVEPKDPAQPVVAEPAFGAGVDARFAPEWAAQPIPERLGTTLVPVRRLVVPGNSTERPNLGLAFEVIGSAATIELADDGPFCEDDLRVPGEARLVRARPGFRPIIKVEAPKLPVVKEQAAVIVLDGKQLILDGIDLVVDVDELPRNQTALFECAGSSLTLRDCTVTVLNPKSAAFALVRTVASARPSRIRIERSFVRGPMFTALELVGGASESFVSRSVVLTGPSALVSASDKEAAVERKVSLVRSLLCSRAPLIELSAPSAGQRSKPFALKALGCTFAAIKGASPPSLIVARGGAGGAGERVQWVGDHNEFAGWSSLYVGGAESNGTVADLAAARRVWAGTDGSSHEQRTPWPDPPSFDRVVLEQLRPLAAERLATLALVPAPSRFLHEKTYFAFERPPVPNLSLDILAPTPTSTAQPTALPATPAMSPPPAAPARVPPKAAVTDPKTFPTGPAPPIRKAAPEPKAKAVPANLVFDLTAAPWHGDLGLYLRDHLEGAGPRLRVYVKGLGDHPFTPIRVPHGISVEILGDLANSPAEVPTWSPAPAASSSAGAMIEVRGGDLVGCGVNFSRGPSADPKFLFQVDHGHLVVYRCRLLSAGVAETGGGGLIAFRALTSEPLAGRASPFTVPVDRPTCRLIDCTLVTGGDAIGAEIGRGRVELTDCAIAAGGSAFVLTPANVARARFEADLLLDRCTVTAERNFVLLEPWKGSAPGPDRPWLVTSQFSAFVASYAAGPRDHVLLRSVGESLAHGVLFWQGNTDAFEVPHFTTVDDRPPTPNPRPDLRRQWLELWGMNHFRNPLGPGKAGAAQSVRFAEKLKPGEVTPRDLVLESRDRRTLDLGADAKVLKLAVPTGRPGRKN